MVAKVSRATPGHRMSSFSAVPRLPSVSACTVFSFIVVYKAEVSVIPISLTLKWPALEVSSFFLHFGVSLQGTQECCQMIAAYIHVRVGEGDSFSSIFYIILNNLLVFDYVHSSGTDIVVPAYTLAKNNTTYLEGLFV